MNRLLSQKFRFYSFVCIALLLYVHAYNLRITYLKPFSTVDEPLTFTTFTEYLLANGLLRFRIPMLFIISGYIFALQDKRPYLDRVKRRFKTLIIPFLIWSAAGLLVTYLLQQFPVTAQAVKNSQMDQWGDNRPYSEIGWLGIVLRWIFKPVSFQLWFIRSLFCYNVLYPLIVRATRKHALLWFIAVYIFWHTMYNIYFVEGQGLFFFSLGVWLSKHNYPIHKKPVWFSRYLSWVFFIGFFLIKTFMAFEFDPDDPSNNYVLTALHELATVSGILAIWYSLDPVVAFFMKQRWFQNLTGFSFIIFALHAPLMQYSTNLIFLFVRHVPNYRLLTYLFLPVFMFGFCILAGSLLRRFAPGFYKLATGGRGF